VKNYAYMTLAVLFAFLLSFNSLNVFSLDEMSFFITVVGLIYGLIAAFTINNAWERFSKIRDAVGQEMNGLSTMYLYAKELSDKKSFERLQSAIIAYCDRVPQIDWSKYWKNEQTHEMFRQIIVIVSQMKIKSVKDTELFDEVSEELRSASIARNTQLILAQTKLSAMQWVLNAFLSLILIAGLVLLSLPNYMLAMFITTSMVSAIIMILLVIYELDSMGFAERDVSCEPYARVIRIVSDGKLQPNVKLWYEDKSAIGPSQ
jgi:hypothetical protein